MNAAAEPPSAGGKLPKHSAKHDALGEVVRLERARRRMSQETLGFRADLHRNYVGALERGEINPTFRVLLKFARGLGVPLSYLMSEAERYERTGEL